MGDILHKAFSDRIFPKRLYLVNINDTVTVNELPIQFCCCHIHFFFSLIHRTINNKNELSISSFFSQNIYYYTYSRIFNYSIIFFITYFESPQDRIHCQQNPRTGPLRGEKRNICVAKLYYLSKLISILDIIYHSFCSFILN